MANIVFTPNQNAWVSPEFFANLYKQRRDLLDAEQTKADATLDTLSTLQAKLQATQDADGNWTGKDAKQAQILQGYIDSATNISNSITSRNASIGDIKRDARNLRREIIPTTTKYVDMLAARDKILSEANKDGYRYSKNFIDKDLEYFGNDENLLYDSYKISEFSDAGKDIMQRYNAMQLPTITHEKTDRPDKQLLTITQGFSEMPTAGEEYEKLLAEAKRYVESRGVDSGSNLYDDLVNDVMEGMSEGLASPKYSVVDNATYLTNAKKAQTEYEARKLKENAYIPMHVNVSTFYNDKNIEYVNTDTKLSAEEALMKSTAKVQDDYNTAVATLKSTINENAKVYLTEKAKAKYDELRKGGASDQEINKFLLDQNNYIPGTKDKRNKEALESIQNIKNLEKKLKYIEEGYYYDNKDNRYSRGFKISHDANEGMAGSLKVSTSKTSDGKTSETYTMDSNFNSFAAIEDYNVNSIKTKINKEINNYLKDVQWEDIKMPKIEIEHDGKNYKLNVIYNLNTSAENIALQRKIISYALLNINYNK